MEFNSLYDIKQSHKPNKMSLKSNKQSHKRSSSYGSIFRLPRPILSDSPVKQNKLQQKETQSSFIHQYRNHLRKTIYTHTKDLMRPNKHSKLKKASLEHNNTQNIHSKSKMKMRNIQTMQLLYHTIISHSPQKKQDLLELSVSKLPIITKINKKKISENHQYSTLIPHNSSIINFRLGRKPKINIIIQKSQIQPWQTGQQLKQYQY